MNHFVGEPRCGKDAGEKLKIACSVPDFFFNFSCRADSGVLARIKLPRWNFIDEPPCSMAKLVDQDDPAVVFQRHHRRGSRVSYDFEVDREAIGQCNGVDIQLHHDSCIDVLAVHWPRGVRLGATGGKLNTSESSVSSRIL